MATNVPLLNSRLAVELYIDGRPELAEGGPPEVFYETTDPNYFRTLGITLLRGRSFSAHDTRDQPRVAIVNEAVARRFWPSGDALGKRIGFDGLEGPWFTIVGIVSNVRRFDLASEPPPQVYVPFLQDPWFFMTFVFRTEAAPESLAPAVRRAVWEVRPDQAIASLQTMEELLAASIARRRFAMLLVGLFAGVALVLTTVGLYGVIAHLVSQRGREISIRMALGADRRNVLSLVLRRSLTLAVMGIVLGIMAALASTRLIANQLYGVSATDLLTYFSVSLQIAAVALLATLLPAWRAMTLDPALALREG